MMANKKNIENMNGRIFIVSMNFNVKVKISTLRSIQNAFAQKRIHKNILKSKRKEHFLCLLSESLRI